MMGWRIGYVAFPDYAHANQDVPGQAPSGPASGSNGSGTAAQQQALTAPGALAMAQLKVGAGLLGSRGASVG